MTDIDLSFDQPLPPGPARQDPFDVAPVKRALAKFGPMVDGLLAEAEALQVEDDASQEDAVRLMADARHLEKDLERHRKDVLAPHKTFVESVNALVRRFTDPLKLVPKDLKAKTSAYTTRKRIEQQEREKAAREERERLQKQIEEEAKAKGVEAPPMPPPVIQEPTQKVTRTEAGSAHTRMEWTFRVLDARQIPLDYLLPPELIAAGEEKVEYSELAPALKTHLKQIRAAVKMGIRNIPGVEIYQKETTVVRSY